MSSKSNDNKQSNSIPYEKLWSILARIPIIKNIRQYNLEAFPLKSLIKQGLKEVYQYIIWKIRYFFVIRKYGLHKIKNYNNLDFRKCSTQEILSVAKHDAHRIEKAFYAGYFRTTKLSSYHNSYQNITRALDELKNRNITESQPDLLWIEEIRDYFFNMQEYVDSKKSDTPSYQPEKLDEFILKSRSRRSTRTWAIDNFHESELINIGNKLIESASWAPCSGNRQAWFFKIITKQNEKNLLIGIKEKHCYSAPMLIFIGIDRKAYGAIGINEQGIHVDGAAAAMQMINTAHFAGLGSCWNHFCKDFVYSRPKNVKIFNNFYKSLHIPKTIEPVALIAFGKPAFISPPPLRPLTNRWLKKTED